MMAVSAVRWTERMLSALANGVKGGKWSSLMDKVVRPETLTAAWQKVAGNGGAAGVDRQGIDRFEARSEVYLGELSQALREQRYEPQPVRRVDIPKGDGKTRPLGIPTVKDRIIQTALKFVLEPIFEAQFRNGSYGFRPGRGCKDALRAVDGLLREGYTFVVDADLQSYFDTIPRERLMQRVEEQVSDGAVLELIDKFLRQAVMQDGKRWTPTGGTPQGAVISPFKQAHGHTFRALDGQIRRRLRALLPKQEKRPGSGLCCVDHQRWSNAFFAQVGLFAMHAGWLAARQSR